jgi:hypothetical protein
VSLAEDVDETADPQALGFITAFAAILIGGALAALAAMAALEKANALPAPPLTGLSCIDEKFKFLHGAPLDGVTLIGVGSSATGRNLDMQPLLSTSRGARPINAAPCQIHVDDTRYLTGFLMEHLEQAKTVVVVTVPRDFETCTGGAFFDSGAARRYVVEKGSGALLYLTRMNLPGFVKDATILADERDPHGRGGLVMDEYGFNPYRDTQPWFPEPKIDEACYRHLALLEDEIVARGGRLIIATLPTMPSWASRFDPDGAFVDGWTRRVRGALDHPHTVFIDGRTLDFTDAEFADATHLVYPHTRTFSELIARRMRDAGA